MSAELRDTLNLLSANTYDRNAAGWRKANRSTARKKRKPGESDFDAFKGWTGPGRMQIKNEDRQI